MQSSDSGLLFNLNVMIEMLACLWLVAELDQSMMLFALLESLLHAWQS